MNGYLSLCNGDPCPPVFRSPVKGMDDIMDNQVICSIYKLPDAHKHITRPPARVVPPKKTVTIEDMKPPPVLWHEDTGGRRRMENGSSNHFRQNPPGSISGRRLGEAAHRLVKNSVQMQTERGSAAEHRHAPRTSYDAAPVGYPYHNGVHHPVNHVTHFGGNPRWQGTGVHNAHGQWSSAAPRPSGQHNRSVHSHYDRNQHNGPHNNHYHGRDSQSDVRRVPPVQSYPQSGGYPYVPPAAQFPVPGPYGQQPGSRSYGGYQAHGTQQWQPRYGSGTGAATGNPAPPAGRGYGNNQSTDNRYSAFNRGGPNRRPPPPAPGYGRY